LSLIEVIRIRGGFLNYATYATQDLTLHGKCRPTVYKMEIFNVAVLFVLLLKKALPPKMKAYILDKRYFFIRAMKEANSVCSVYEHDHVSFHHYFTSSPAKFDCIAQQGWTGNGSNPMCARAVTIR